MADVKYYLKHYPAPVFCFTPDAEFPVCNGKGHSVRSWSARSATVRSRISWAAWPTMLCRTVPARWVETDITS